MSINISLIPLALVMRVVMGEKGFEDFVRKNEDVRYTKFKSFKDIERIVKKSGYDFVEQWGMLKTHFKTKDYFLWEIRSGYVCAVFSVYDADLDVNNFIRAIEQTIGAKCFYNSAEEINIEEINTNIQHKKEMQAQRVIEPQKEIQTKKEIQVPIVEQVFQTKFTDKNLLIKALTSIGLNCVEKNNEITCSSDNYTLIFTNKNNLYEFRIKGNVSNKEAYQKYKDIDTRYAKELQQEIIQNVKQKVAKSPTMHLEQEEVLEDNSVLLTITI